MEPQKMDRVFEIVKQCFPGRKAREVSILADDTVTDSRVVQVLLNKIGYERRVIVVKISSRLRIKREVKGYELLKPYYNTSIPELLHRGDDFIVIQFVRDLIGNLKDIVCSENHRGIPEAEILSLFDSVLEIKDKVWRDTLQPGNPKGSNSIIRLEMDDTVQKLGQVFGNEIDCPVIIKGKQYPSLAACIDKLNAFLAEDSLPTVIAHGDLKPENILIYRTRRNKDRWFKLIDLEWAGRIDWAEALMRVAKYCSSKTSLADGTPSYGRDSGRVTLYYKVRHKDVCKELQNRARNFGATFASCVPGGDSTWEKRLDYYLAASLLREIVLLRKRNLPPSLSVPLWGEIVRLIDKHP